MQVDRIQRLIHSDNIDDVYLGYILMNDDKEFAKIILQKNDLEKIYIVYNDHIVIYNKMLSSKSDQMRILKEIKRSGSVSNLARRFLDADTKIFQSYGETYLIIEGTK